MSGPLCDFLAAHAGRVAALWFARAGSDDAAQVDACPSTAAEAATFVDAARRVLCSGETGALVEVSGLGDGGSAVELRLDRALRRLESLGRVLREEAARSGVDGVDTDAADAAIAAISRRLAVRVTAELAGRAGPAGITRGRDASISITMHELRRPLTIMSSYAQLLDSGMLGALPPSAVTAVDNISAGVDMMVRLVNSLAEVSRLEDPEEGLSLQQVRLDEMVEEAIDQVRMEAQLRGTRFETEVSGSLAVSADRHALVLAITNLLSNAVKHSPSGEPITIRGFAAEDSARVVVTDRGPGFPSEDAPHLFEKYFRSTADRMRGLPGSGLGLYIVRTVIERHGGAVSARAAQTGGAEFELILPIR